MHRTGSIDLMVILEGEIVLQHAGADEVTLRRGGVVVQSGGMHRWESRGSEPCVAAAVLLTTAREADGR